MLKDNIQRHWFLWTSYFSPDNEKKGIIQRKSLHEEVGNLFKRILFDCISLPEYIKARKKDDKMCDLTHEKKKSQHTDQLKKDKEKNKAIP